MEAFTQIKQHISTDGFAIINDFYTEQALNGILETISEADQSGAAFRKSRNLFAIRQFFREVPHSFSLVFDGRLEHLISHLFGVGYFVVKSIYFDKPENSNWCVPYHQDLTIAVLNKVQSGDYLNWTKKQEHYAVQPPLHILGDNFTIRIHLDDTNADNGALRVVQGSHRKEIYRPENIDWDKELEITCSVNRGGIMIMKPLLLHASKRTTGNQRRVIHVEFSRTLLPDDLNWAEFQALKSYPHDLLAQERSRGQKRTEQNNI